MPTASLRPPDAADPAARVAQFDWLALWAARRYAAAVPPGGAADDLAQECRVALIRAAAKFDPARGHPFAAYAATVVARAARSFVRAEHRRGFVGLAPDQRVAPVRGEADAGEGDPEQIVDPAGVPVRWGRDRWQRVLGCLPPRERRVLVLRLFNGRTTREIARELGIGSARAAQLWARAVTRIRQCVHDLDDPVGV